MKIRNPYFATIFTVFLLAVFMRIYWIHEKELVYYDELASVTEAYTGQTCLQSIETNRIYKGAELHRMLYVDDQGGWKGLWNDLKVLHTDNHDYSHASLYYMLLRVAFLGIGTASPDTIIRHGCGLNLFFFILSFVCMASLLKELFPKPHRFLIPFLLLFAYLNPAGISNVLLVREYQLSEALFVAWTWWCLRTYRRIENRQRLWNATTMASGCFLSALLLSSGYFCAIYIALTIVLLAIFCYKQHSKKGIVALITIAAGCILLCYLFYLGFFNFLHDIRTTEVRGKLQGNDWLYNLLETCAKSSIKYVIYVLTPIGFFMVFFAVYKFLRIRWKPVLNFRNWLLTAVFIWAVVIMSLSPWKFTRYYSAAIPLLMAVTGYFCFTALQRKPKMLISGAVLFVLYSFCEMPIQYLERKDATELKLTKRIPGSSLPTGVELRHTRKWHPEAHRILVDASGYGYVAHLIAYMQDDQELVIVENDKSIPKYASDKDTIAYVYVFDETKDKFDIPLKQTEKGAKFGWFSEWHYPIFPVK